MRTIATSVTATATLTFLIVVSSASLVRAAAAPVEKVNASYGAISGSMLPIWIAKEARFFEKYGLDLNLVYISGGPRAIMSLIGGSVQFVNHSGMPALEAYQRGADTALIASPMNQLEHSLVVQKNITSVEQLRGKILGMSTAGSLTDVLLREGLRLNGIPEKDVTILPVGDLGARLSALQTGRLHGVIVAGVQTLAATKMGFKQLIDFSKLPIEISGSGILVRRAYVMKNQETTLKFLKAWIEGIYLLKAKPEFGLGVLRKYVATQDTEVLNTIYGHYKDKLDTKPTPLGRVAKSMFYLLSRTNPDIPGGNPEGFVDTRFINQLESAGFFDEMNRQYGK
ncbi:MAG: ABC transporter substrate-binding protein [Deltaproteobacteria bacterium]|nr:ABC transporter substrate-binding protein [Deltaproteobacteria bacterium]